MNITLTRKTNSGGKILEPGTLLDLPETKARKLIDLGIAREVVPETRIQKITRATHPDELIEAMADYIPGQLSDSELAELTKAYETKMAEILPDEWPETPIEQPTLPEASEPCLSGQNQGHPERITPHLGWNGQEVVTLPRCGDCRHFTRDSVNPEYGLGDCQVFLLPDGKRHAARYPAQRPKNGTCFERESPR